MKLTLHTIKRFFSVLIAAAAICFAGQVSADATMACSCTASACGNNAVGGDQGDVFSGLSPTTVDEMFLTNPNTGWTCVVPAKVRGSGGPLACFCAGYCGNGGIGADPNYFDLGLSPSTVSSSYGGGKPGNKTGWLCGNYRGTINYTPPKTSYQKMDFGFNGCKVAWGPLQTNVSEATMVKLATDANANGFTYQPQLNYGQLLIGNYPMDCKSPANMSWPLYLKQ